MKAKRLIPVALVTLVALVALLLTLPRSFEEYLFAVEAEKTISSSMSAVCAVSYAASSSSVSMTPLREVCAFYASRVRPKLLQLLRQIRREPEELLVLCESFEREKRLLARALVGVGFYMASLVTSAVDAAFVSELRSSALRPAAVRVRDAQCARAFAAHRAAKAAAVSELIQDKLRKVQDPKDCKNGQQLSCYNKPLGGFAYGINRLLWCLAAALETSRRLVYSERMLALRRSVFLPLNTRCENYMFSPSQGFPWYPASPAQQYEVMSVHPLRFLRMPCKVPLDVAAGLGRVVDDPTAWYLGQLAKFALRPTNDTIRYIKNKSDAIQETV